VQTLRTPDDRFAGLPGYDFEPHYATIDDLDGGELRVHYVDEGDPTAAPVLLMHGEPSWSFLYRHMIPPIVAAGHRVVAPDLVGFGRSDKPTEMDDYSYARHVRWMEQLLIERLDLRDLSFFGQDWGGLVGLRLVAAHPDRYARVIVGNTGLPTGHGKPSDAFLAWQQFSQTTEHFPVGGIINGGCTTDLAAEVIAGYDAPFPDDSYKAGARIFPTLVPTSPDDPATPDNEAAWEVLSRFEKPWLCAFSDSDPITKGTERVFLERVPGTKGQPHTTIEGGGHFLQEDRGPELAKVIVDFIAATA
jgi:haloalkane dehalogenase